MSTLVTGRRQAFWRTLQTLLWVGLVITGCTPAMTNGERMAQTAATTTPQAQPTDRYRDLFIDSTSGAFYVITDSGNNTQGSFRIPTAALEHPGALLEFSYTSRE